jgi:O-antigen/teichoic acid export membrane protein
MGKVKERAKTIFFALIANILLNLILINTIGLVGATIAM